MQTEEGNAAEGRSRSSGAILTGDHPHGRGQGVSGKVFFRGDHPSILGVWVKGKIFSPSLRGRGSIGVPPQIAPTGVVNFFSGSRSRSSSRKSTSPPAVLVITCVITSALFRVVFFGDTR